MEGCYRSTPKFVGAFIDALYQNPSMLFLMVVGASALAGWWWFRSRKMPGNPE